MGVLLVAMLAAFSSAARAEDALRSGSPKGSYFYAWGKGPQWTAQVCTELGLSLLNLKMPYVDDQYSEPTEKVLSRVPRQNEPIIATIASGAGRSVIQVVYPEKGSFGRTIGTIHLAIETARNSEWFSPFLGGPPELYRGQLVGGSDVAYGYVATLETSGTGALQTAPRGATASRLLAGLTTFPPSGL